jgi:hypothetical protein
MRLNAVTLGQTTFGHMHFREAVRIQTVRLTTTTSTSR